MSDNATRAAIPMPTICPLCKIPYSDCNCHAPDLIAEIARLKAGLEKAEMERDNNHCLMLSGRMVDELIDARKKAINERDEARAALEKAEMERDDWKQGYKRWFEAFWNIRLRRDETLIVERDEARKWAGRMLREATIAQQNHVAAIQREVINGSKLFDRETKLTTLAKELSIVQRERDAEVERAVEAETEVERLKVALTSVYNRGYKTSAAVAVAEVCDTELDRSGRLLEEIREASRKLKGYA